MKRFLNTNVTKNKFPKLCINCKYFISVDFRWPDERLDHSRGKCKLFGKTNLVSGDIKYEYASLARENDKMCGKIGKLFETHLDI